MRSATGLVIVLLAAAVAPARAAEVCGDADGNGSVTVSDGVNVLRAAAGLSVNLACPGGGGPTCTSATVTVSLAVPEPIGAATLTLRYPTAVALPGSGDAAAERVTIVTSSSLLENGSPNDRDDRVDFFLVAPDGLGNGNLLAVRFDCGGVAPGAAAFTCSLADVTAPDGFTPVTGATCGAHLVTD